MSTQCTNQSNIVTVASVKNNAANFAKALLSGETELDFTAELGCTVKPVRYAGGQLVFSARQNKAIARNEEPTKLPAVRVVFIGEGTATYQLKVIGVDHDVYPTVPPCAKVWIGSTDKGSKDALIGVFDADGNAVELPAPTYIMVP